MRFSKILTPFCLLSFAALLLPQVVYGILNPIMHICSTPHHNPNEGFATNLKQLVTSLSHIVPGSGYGRVSLGPNSDKVHGIALCTDNIRNQQCKTCLDYAGSEIITRCPSNKRAIIWYDDCMLKYSDKEFYGRVDLRNNLHQCNLQGITPSYRYKFAMARLSLFDTLMTRIYENPNLYAAGRVDMASSTNVKIYGFVQCSRDISIQRCHKCLGRICERLHHACYRSLGGKYLTGSCSVRYELYPFAHRHVPNRSSAPVFPPPSTLRIAAPDGVSWTHIDTSAQEGRDPSSLSMNAHGGHEMRLMERNEVFFDVLPPR